MALFDDMVQGLTSSWVPSVLVGVGVALVAPNGSQHVEVSPITGSVLVLYDPGMAESFTLESLEAEAVSSLTALADALGLSLEDIDMDEFQRWLHATRNGTHPETPGELGS